MQQEFQTHAKEKLEYLQKYEPLNDFIQANQTKHQKQITDSDYKLDPSEVNVKLLRDQLKEIQVAGTLEDFIIVKTQIVASIISGLNGLVYGIGSKQDLLNNIIIDITEQYIRNYRKMSDITVFQIKGFRPQVNMNIFIQHMMSVVDKKGNHKKAHSIYDFLNHHLNRRVLIVIHSIDSKYLANTQQQQIIADLANCHFITILGSFDNFRYPQIQRQLNVMYHKMNTFEPYIDEVIFEESIAKSRLEEGLWYILQSMNHKQNAIVNHLSKRQLTESKDGVTFQELADLVIDEMIVNNVQGLRENLKELQEHKIIILKKEKYLLDYSDKILKQLADRIE